MTDSRVAHLRRSTRYPVRIAVNASSLGVFLESRIMNLSKGGVFLRADIALPPGTPIDLEFAVPGTAAPLKVAGVVVWARNAAAGPPASFPEHPPGMGIEFRSIEPGDLDTLLRAVEGASRIPE